METIEGYVERITYRNPENGYTVLAISSDSEETTAVGIFPIVSEGEYVRLTGDFTIHPTYGPQFKTVSYETATPSTEAEIERYLSSGAIRGIGEKLAHRIVSVFHDDTFRIFEEEPERLAEVRGISLTMAMDFSDQVVTKRDARNAMLFFEKLDIPVSIGMKIYQKYGERMTAVLNENPYVIADEISGIGFQTADEIAMKMNVSPESEYRIKSAILFCLTRALYDGNTFLYREDLLLKTEALLSFSLSETGRLLEDLTIDRRIRLKKDGDGCRVYLYSVYQAERETAIRLHEMNLTDDFRKDARIETCLSKAEKESSLVFNETQREAVKTAMKNTVTIITGGPGTGKTTTINAIISVFCQEGLEMVLAAPTGRAAKRMTEATGYEAKTIHRLLEVKGDMSESDRGTFTRNAEYPLETDVVIIDEMSMVDIFLFHSLLAAMTPGMRLILVGDADQLPSVGAGNVLKDLMDSHCFPVVKLTKIFRQDTDSDIIVNAHKINEGEIVAMKPSKDFLFIPREDSGKILGATITLMKEKLPPYVQADARSLQVLTPMKKGPLGVENVNRCLQQSMNPGGEGKAEIKTGEVTFREGDKVMQVKNNYDLEWHIGGAHPEYGAGIFNGEIGVILSINHYEEQMTVLFDDEKTVDYPFSLLNELELAYAITIHKSQGSEYPAVVLPLLSGPDLLMNRRLLYTAVTRAKKCVCIVGSYDTFCRMTQNVSHVQRLSGLKDMILESYEICNG